MDTHAVIEPLRSRALQSSEQVGVLAGFLEEVMLERKAEEEALSPRSKLSHREVAGVTVIMQEWWA